MYQYECEYTEGETKEKWYGNINEVHQHRGTVELNITGRGTKITALIGRIPTYTWICFPEKEYSCSLAAFWDTWWNENAMSEGLGIIDAITVAKGLHLLSAELENYLCE